jgi:hypothetical protein
MARKGRGNVTVTFNSVALTNYTTQAELSMTVDRIETTHFGSTGAESIAGDTAYKIPLSGDWDVALDTAIAPEAITTGTQRTAVIVFTGASQAVTYTWTSKAEVEEYSVSADASGKITWSATLILNGAPSSRGVA